MAGLLVGTVRLGLGLADLLLGLVREKLAERARERRRAPPAVHNQVGDAHDVVQAGTIHGGVTICTGRCHHPDRCRRDER
ncbi:hypothetical protein SAMN05421810_107293 [Amycolatopsis arida]|uniref:Uncharacterized protein n=1 Tax=Amycolatopsis arida TaxID=587909 RepID=A0A1I5YNB9_9PSEU|nr:hypothetical protein [Amycolatopsis arida]TDX90646.1 hypothetical protein CLV69_107293 [Amycolatopsis arida]SFQ45761.1 hypothetical protein SAMN05421810_107293 [Amycolatopsis arida]